MKESDYRKKWKRSFFRLEDGRLSYYAKKAVANAKPTKTMELTAQSTTSHATIDKCFYVTTEKVGGGGGNLRLRRRGALPRAHPCVQAGVVFSSCP